MDILGKKWSLSAGGVFMRQTVLFEKILCTIAPFTLE